jgi:hypothetical protein
MKIFGNEKVAFHLEHGCKNTGIFHAPGPYLCLNHPFPHSFIISFGGYVRGPFPFRAIGKERQENGNEDDGKRLLLHVSQTITVAEILSILDIP